MQSIAQKIKKLTMKYCMAFIINKFLILIDSDGTSIKRLNIWFETGFIMKLFKVI